jgi:hypothetical protein
VIYEIILSGLHTARRAEVHPVRFACALDLFIVASQADKFRVELFQILLQDFRVVARGIACDHKRKEHLAALLNHLVVHEGHFVEFVRADVGTVGEAEVDLERHELAIELISQLVD